MEVSGKKTEKEQNTSSTSSEHKSLEAATENKDWTIATKKNEDMEFKDSPATTEVEQRLEEYSLKTNRSVDERNKAFTANNLQGYENETCKADENNSDLSSKNTHWNEDIKTNEINNEENDTYVGSIPSLKQDTLVYNKKAGSKTTCSVSVENLKTEKLFTDPYPQKCNTGKNENFESFYSRCVDKVPIDIKVNMAETQDQSKESLTCDPCEHEKEFQCAEGYCVECDEFLCAGCYKAHSRVSLTRQHNLQSRECMPKHKSNLKKITNKEPCSKHIGSVIEFYCEADEELCCCICVRSDHSCCKNVKRITDIADEFSESNDYRNTMESLDFVVEMGKSFESQLRESYVVVEGYLSKTRKRVLGYRREINALFDKLERDILSKIDSKQKDDTNELESLHQRISTMLFEVQAIKELIHTLRLKSDENYKLFISVKKLNKKINSCFEDIKCMKQKNIIHGYEFKADEKIEKLQNGDITNLGELCMKMPETPAAKLISESHVIKLGSKSVIDGSVDASKDSACRITGVAATKSEIIIVDNANCMIKRFSIKGSTELDREKFSSAPYDVTLLVADGSEIALTFPDEEEIKMMSIIKEGKRGRSIKTHCACKNIGFIHREQIVVTVRGSDNVLILDIYGKPLKLFLFTDSRLENIDIGLHSFSFFPLDKEPVVKGRIRYKKSTPSWSTSTQVTDDLIFCSGRKGFVLVRKDNLYAFDCNGHKEWTLNPRCIPKLLTIDEYGTLYVASSRQSDMKPVTMIESHTTRWYKHTAAVTPLANSPTSSIHCEKMNVSCMVFCEATSQLFVAADEDIRIFPVL